MNRMERYSDEFLNAFIDDELADEDKERLLNELRQNNGLSNRVCELRKVRDMVQHAYNNVELPHTPSDQHGHRQLLKGRTRKAIAASFIMALGVSLGWISQSHYQPKHGLLELAQAMQFNQSANPNADEWRLVLHVTTGDQFKLNNVLAEAESILQAHQQGTRKVKVNILANGQGLNLLRSDTTPFAKRIHELQSRYSNLTFQACQNAITRLKKEKGIEAKIIPEAVIVPSALSEIIHRQKEGWTYIQI